MRNDQIALIFLIVFDFNPGGDGNPFIHRQVDRFGALAQVTD